FDEDRILIDLPLQADMRAAGAFKAHSLPPDIRSSPRLAIDKRSCDLLFDKQPWGLANEQSVQQ
ncbi:MAG: hypothetical protein ACM3IG_11695, partial [Myxococcales bacterium]